jgi:Indole-3-glycerol phosphate synthase
MKDILTDIIEAKQFTLKAQKKAISMDMLRDSATEERKIISMSEALASSPSGIIAEFKRKSPSKGWINKDASVEEVTAAYAANGASALSILTDGPFFGGNLKDLKNARSGVNIPILRKDFIIDEYQLYQARIIGADAVLLIAAALKKEECKFLADRAHELGLEVLLEIHSESELEYVDSSIEMVGVNNRNLGTFVTDIENSFRLASLLPKETVLVSESGISSPETVKKLREAGFRGFLIGENFMKTGNPGIALGEFIKQLK